METRQRAGTKVLVTRVIMAAIMEGLDDHEVLERVARLVPESLTKRQSVKGLRCIMNAVDRVTHSPSGPHAGGPDQMTRMIVDSLMAGDSNERAAARVRAAMPWVPMSANRVCQHRSVLRWLGVPVPTGLRAARGLVDLVALPPLPPREDATVIPFQRPVPRPLRAPRVTVGSVAKEAILALMTDEEALAVVKARMPGSMTTMSNIAHYRSCLVAEGAAVPSCKEVKRMRRAAEMNLAC